MSLENLPLEVIHHIFALLPATTLTSLRLTSSPLRSSATSNHLWRSHFQALHPAHWALVDIAEVPTSAWSFSLVPDGWFRAYTAVMRTAHSEWLWTEEQLQESKWTVSFKAFLKEGGARGSDAEIAWHALVEMRSDLTCHSLEGLPLNSSRWYVDARPSLRFSGYPPNVPSRDPYTWCRIMQHVSVLMMSDAPEFLDALVALNTTIIAETTALSENIRREREREFRRVVEAVLERRRAGFGERLKKMHVERSGAMERAGVDYAIAAVGGGGIGGRSVGGGGGGGATDEGSDWSREGDESDEEWDGGYGYGFAEGAPSALESSRYGVVVVF